MHHTISSIREMQRGVPMSENSSVMQPFRKQRQRMHNERLEYGNG
jgi:hypothetical protein